MRDVPEPLTISNDTFELLLRSMLTAMEVIDRDAQVPGYDLALMPAMLSALSGTREDVLRDVAIALSPDAGDAQ